jgi:hypothetical protein
MLGRTGRVRRSKSLVQSKTGFIPKRHIYAESEKVHFMEKHATFDVSGSFSTA